MNDLTCGPLTDPTAVYRPRDGLYAADLLTTALVHLDLFSVIGEAPTDLAGLCSSIGIAERPGDVMMTLFQAMGLIRCEGGLFHLTGLAREHLVRGSPWFIGPYYASLKDRPVCLDLLRVLRTGRPANWGSYRDGKEWAQAMAEEGFAEQFTAAMDCRGVFLGKKLADALDLTGRRSLLDVAGGSGIYACALAAANPGLLAFVMEKPPVDGVAQRAIARRGFGARVQVVPADMFDPPWPGGHDVHLLSNVLHDWDVPVVRRLLQSSFEALVPGGCLVVHDVHLNADKSGPFPAAAYSVMLMHSTEGRCYSIAELEGWLGGAGFQSFRFLPTAADRSLVIATKPK